MSRTELLFLLLCFPVSWSFGWTMARYWMRLRWVVHLEQVAAQARELKRVTAQLEALMKETEKEQE